MIRYELSNEGKPPSTTGAVHKIDVPYTPGVWNHLSLPVSDDAKDAFAPFDGDDNALGEIHFGVISRMGVTAEVQFDALQIHQAVPTGDMLDKQVELVDGLASAYPSVHQIVGLEQSYMAIHLNEFSLAPELIDYESLYSASGLLDDDGQISDEGAMTAFVTRAIVDEIHDREGLVSLNHIFGPDIAPNPTTPTKEQMLQQLLDNGAWGPTCSRSDTASESGHWWTSSGSGTSWGEAAVISSGTASPTATQGRGPSTRRWTTTW